MTDGFTNELPPVPLVGGPYDGGRASITIIMPFLGGGMPSSLLKLEGGHWYELAADRSKWVYMEMSPMKPEDGK